MRLVEGQVEEERFPRGRVLRHELLRLDVDLLGEGREVDGLLTTLEVRGDPGSTSGYQQSLKFW